MRILSGVKSGDTVRYSHKADKGNAGRYGAAFAVIFLCALSALLHYADEEFNRAVDCFHSDMLVVAVDGAALFGIVNKSLLP